MQLRSRGHAASARGIAGATMAVAFRYFFGGSPGPLRARPSRDVHELVTLIRFAAARDHCMYIAYFILNQGDASLHYRRHRQRKEEETEEIVIHLLDP